MSEALDEVLKQMHVALAEELLARIKSGEAKPADLAVARQFLKDSGIDAIPTEDNHVGKLTQILPFEAVAARSR